MLTVTDGAKQTLKELLLETTDDPEIGLRLVVRAVEPVRTGLVADREKPGDFVVHDDVYKVLLVAAEVAEVVAGATMDSEDTPDGTKLVISREPL